jgi:hypothetical protein
MSAIQYVNFLSIILTFFFSKCAVLDKKILKSQEQKYRIALMNYLNEKTIFFTAEHSEKINDLFPLYQVN